MSRLASRWNPWRGLEGLPLSVWIVSAATLINRMGTMVLPFLAIYITDEMGLPPSGAGVALMAFGIGGFLSAPLGGWLSDRIGAVWVMVGAFVGSGALLLTFPFVDRYETLLGLIGVWALVNESARPATLVALTDGLDPTQRKAAIALSRLAMNLGMGIGPAVGGVLVATSFDLLFWVDGITAMTAGLFLALTVVQIGWKRPVRDGVVASPVEVIGALLDRKLMGLLFGTFLVILVFDQHRSTLPLFITDNLGFSEQFYGSLFIINVAIILLLEVPLNLKTAHWPHGRTLALGAVLVALGFGATALAVGPGSVIATVVVWTFGEMLLFPSMAAYVADVAPEERRGAYMGAYGLAIWVAVIPAPLAGTWLLEHYGGGTLWGAALVVGLLAAVAMGRLRDTRTLHPTGA
ncbi:MAG: MFS transporter [Rhodothermaceae bacterium]|nr:MFS transporter [Rhodothermaceae bacterium]